MNGVVLYAAILLMIAFWSGNYIVGKIALREFPPLLLVGLRIGCAGLFVLPFYGWERRGKPASWTGRDVPVLLLLGVFGVTLNQLFFVVGLSRTSVAHSALIVGLMPMQVLLLACLSGQERLTPRKAAGMTIALAGAAVLKIFEPTVGATNGSGATWLGDLFILLSGLFFAIFTVSGKATVKLHSAATVNTFAYVGGALALAPVTLWEASQHPVGRASTAAWLSMLYMALFPSVLAYLIYYYALAHITASRLAAFQYLQPVFGTAMGVILLQKGRGRNGHYPPRRASSNCRTRTMAGTPPCSM